MALSFGFYNSVNHDRKYFAEDMSRILDGVISEGVFSSVGKHYAVTANGGNEIKVESGNAWFNHTWTYNDSYVVKELSVSDVINDRIDAVVIEVNRSDDVRENSIQIVTGTPSSTPAKPTLTNTDLVSQHPIAYIYRKANSTAIVQSDITSCVGTEECPFVTGPVNTVTADDLLKKWQAEFEEWIQSTKTDGSQVIEDIKPEIEAQMQSYLEEMSKIRDEASEKMSKLEANFNAWFDSIKDQLGIYKSVSVAAQAVSTEWAGDKAPYTNTISVDGVTASNIIDVGLASFASDDQVKATTEASICKVTQADGSITLYAYGSKPSIDIPVTVVIRDVKQETSSSETE